MFCKVIIHVNSIYYIIQNVTKNRLLGESVEKPSQSLLEEVVAVRIEPRVNGIFKDIFLFHDFG